MFESLTTNLQDAFTKMRRRGKLRSADIDEALHDVRLALLDADVHYQVVKELIDSVRQGALGEEVSKALHLSV